MEETRRFIRLALPGLAVVVEFALLAALTWPDAAKNVPGGVDPMAAAVVAVVVSGGLGFVFSVLYFSAYWSWLFGPLLAIDHEGALRALANAYRASGQHERDLLRLDAQIAGLPTACMDRRRAAWTILTAWWFARVGTSTTLAGAEVKTRNLIDHAHALGTTGTGTLIAFTVWLAFVIASLPDGGRVVAALSAWVVLAASQWMNHRHLHTLFARTVEEVVEEFVHDPRAVPASAG